MFEERKDAITRIIAVLEKNSHKYLGLNNTELESAISKDFPSAVNSSWHNFKLLYKAYNASKYLKQSLLEDVITHFKNKAPKTSEKTSDIFKKEQKQAFDSIIQVLEKDSSKYLQQDKENADIAITMDARKELTNIRKKLPTFYKWFIKDTMVSSAFLSKVKKHFEQKRSEEPPKLKKSDIPGIVRLYMPNAQQGAIVGSREHWNTLDRLQKDMQECPRIGAADGVSKDEVIVYLRYFTRTGSEKFITEIDPKSGEMYGYHILNGDAQMSEYGYDNIHNFKDTPHVELDFYWRKKSLAQALYDYDSEYFPNPKKKVVKTPQKATVKKQPDNPNTVLKFMPSKQIKNGIGDVNMDELAKAIKNTPGMGQASLKKDEMMVAIQYLNDKGNLYFVTEIDTNTGDMYGYLIPDGEVKASGFHYINIDDFKRKRKEVMMLSALPEKVSLEEALHHLDSNYFPKTKDTNLPVLGDKGTKSARLSKDEFLAIKAKTMPYDRSKTNFGYAFESDKYFRFDIDAFALLLVALENELLETYHKSLVSYLSVEAVELKFEQKELIEKMIVLLRELRDFQIQKDIEDTGESYWMRLLKDEQQFIHDNNNSHRYKGYASILEEKGSKKIARHYLDNVEDWEKAMYYNLATEVKYAIEKIVDSRYGYGIEQYFMPFFNELLASVNQFIETHENILKKIIPVFKRDIRLDKSFK